RDRDRRHRCVPRGPVADHSDHHLDAQPARDPRRGRRRRPGRGELGSTGEPPLKPLGVLGGHLLRLGRRAHTGHHQRAQPVPEGHHLQCHGRRLRSGQTAGGQSAGEVFGERAQVSAIGITGRGRAGHGQHLERDSDAVEGPARLVGGQRLGEEGTDLLHGCAGTVGRRRAGSPAVHALRSQTVQGGREQLVLGPSVVLHQPQRNPGLGGDRPHRDCVYAALSKQVLGRIQDLRAPVVSGRHFVVLRDDDTLVPMLIQRYHRRSSGRTGPRAVLLVACVAQLLVVVDISVVNVALPSIQAELAMSRRTASWVAMAYTLGFGGALLVGARLADVLGTARVLAGGVIAFTFASLAGGLAPAAGVLIGARAAQGIAAAVVAPATFTLITRCYPEG